MKRIGIGQIWQESNSFNPIPTAIVDFKRWGLVEGSKVLEKYGKENEIGGFISGLKAWPTSYEPVGLLRAMAWPAGPLEGETLRWFVHAILENISKAGHLDGVLLCLHGAMASEEETDADGLLLETVRRGVGDDVPVVATIDCHAHITPKMIENANALVAYHTNPHMDRFDTGERAAAVLYNIIRGADPVYGFVKVPMITVAEVQNTSGEMLSPIFRRLQELEAQKVILSAGILMTQAWLDVPKLGWSILVVTDGEGISAQKLANDLAEMCWDRCREMSGYFKAFCSAEQAVSRALACEGKPVVISDGADATNSGAPGDSTHLLRAMVGKNIPGGALSIMVDPEAVAYARSVGRGGKFEFAVGGKRDHVFCDPLLVTGKVISLQPARYRLFGHLGNNLAIDMGLSATVRICDVTLLLVEYAGPGSSAMMYLCAGLEPKKFKIVIVKSPAGFRAEFEPFAADIILTDIPGCASPKFERMPFTKINRPLWPLDEIGDWHKVDWTH